MAGDTVITIIGNLTADPELRFTPSGAAVADFTIASTPRTFDKARNEWTDANTLFLRCSVWREQAENVAETLRKGMRVIVQGRLVQRSYETKDGQQRTVVELQADEVGVSLRAAKAQVVRTHGQQQAQGGYQQAPQTNPGPGQQYQQAPAQQGQWNAPQGGQPNDPWRTNTGGTPTSFNNEPPF